MRKPLLNISNPKPISPGGAYWLQGFEPETVGNRNQLRQNFQVAFTMNSATHADWANFQIVNDAVYKKESQDYVYFIGGRYISRHLILNPALETAGAIINTITGAGGTHSCASPAITETEQGNMLYSSEQNLGKAYYGTSNGSQTIKIIDDAGRDLSALDGLVVRNIRTNATATITSVTTTTATNDTINFTGGWSDAGSIGDGHEWVVFVDTFQALNIPAFPQYGGQVPYTQWYRPILNFDGDYFIGNGNYISKLSNDETTFDGDYSQLPSFTQLMCMEQIGNNIIIGGTRNRKGLIMLWDGVTPNKYQSIIAMSLPVYAVKEYRGGAIIYSGSSLYWTDGYSIKRLSTLPGTAGFGNYAITHNGFAIDGQNVYLNAGGSAFYSFKKGVWVYNIERDSWTYNPYETSAGVRLIDDTTAGAILPVGFSNGDYLFASYSATARSLARITRTGGNNFSMAVFAYTAPRNTKINYAELVLGQSMSRVDATKPDVKITMALSDGKRPFWLYGQSKTGITSTAYNEISIDGSGVNFNKAEVGDLIMMLSGVNPGQYAFITKIENKDTASEKWTMDKNFTAYTTTTNNFQIFHCTKMGEHNVTDYFEQPLVFPNGLTISGDFYVFIIIEGSGQIDLRDISLF